MTLYNFADTRVYLPGPMESMRDKQAHWRNRLKPMLLDLGFQKKNIVDPVERQPEGEYQELDRLRGERDWDGFQALAKKIVQHDLRYVDLCDILVGHLFHGVQTCGTWDEVFMACLQRKPVFLAMNEWQDKCPAWIVGRIGHEMMHENIEEVVENLKRLQRGEWKPKGWRPLDERYEIDG